MTSNMERLAVGLEIALVGLLLGFVQPLHVSSVPLAN